MLLICVVNVKHRHIILAKAVGGGGGGHYRQKKLGVPVSIDTQRNDTQGLSAHHSLKETLTGRQDPRTTGGDLTKPEKADEVA